jgi:hypothetical protein
MKLELVGGSVWLGECPSSRKEGFKGGLSFLPLF